MFSRPQQRYGDTPVPITPYQKAAQLWDERIGSARVQARNWRFMAFALLAISAGLAGSLTWQSLQSRITPYVIEVDRFGEVQLVGLAERLYEPNEAQIAYYLAKFIRNVRGLSIDPVMVRRAWLEAYDFATDRAAQVLNAFATAQDPFKAIAERSVAVEITSVVQMSDDSFQIKWQEETWRHGSRLKSEHWTAILTIVTETPRDVTTLRKNPLGIYVHGLHWSRDIRPGELP